MPVTSVHKDPELLTLTVVADFKASRDRLWEAYVDPRQLEKFWGPPTYPARFTRHDVCVGGRSLYTMTGPEGDVSAGYWEFTDVKAPHSFEVVDGFRREDGTPNTDLPSMRMTFSFEETDTGSRLTTTTFFNSADELEQLLSMGMEEGMQQAMAQIDDVLADLRTFAADRPTAAEILSDTQVRVARVIKGAPEQVWRAHHEPALLQQWLLGPDGWSMPECTVATEVGETYTYVWAADDGSATFYSTGELLEVSPPHRSVTSERMVGDFIPPDAPGATNEMTLTAVPGGTLLSIVITYADAETRDAVLATGMTDGMETSYVRLESIL